MDSWVTARTVHADGRSRMSGKFRLAMDWVTTEYLLNPVPGQPVQDAAVPE